MLLSFADEEFALIMDSTEEVLPSKDSQVKWAWQTDFLPVSQALLNRIQAHYAPLSPLPLNQLQQIQEHLH